jgi:hypothetical protein
LILARGKLLFVGPPADAPAYFGVARLGDIYDRLPEREPEEWEKRFAGSSQYAEFVARRIAAEPRSAAVEGGGARNRHVELVASGAVPPPSKRPLLAGRMHELFSAGMGRAAEMIRPVSEHWHQFKVLTRRYARLVLNDPRSLRLLFLQAPIVALFLLIGFVNKPYEGKMPTTRRLTETERGAILVIKGLLNLREDPSVLTPEQRRALQEIRVPRLDGEGSQSLYDALAGLGGEKQKELLELLLTTEDPVIPNFTEPIVNPAYTYLLLSIVVIAILWFGCNNAAKEIVKEEAIYGRERAVNLRIGPYLASKFVVLGVISAVQTLLFMLVLYGALELLRLFAGHQAPPLQYRLDYFSQYGVLLMLALTGVALGLLLSSCVSSPDRANALLPYVLIPQMILGGGVIVVREGLIYWLAVTLSPVYWAFRAIRTGECELPQDMYYRMSYEDDVGLACAAMAAQAVVMLLLTAWFLRKKDSQ